MIQLNNTNIRYINLGSTPVEKAFLGDKLIFKTPPYILIQSDAQDDNEVTVIANRKSVSTTNNVTKVVKNVNAQNSPVRIDIPGEEDGPLKVIQFQYGKISKIDMNGYDLTGLDHIYNIFSGSFSENKDRPGDYIREIVLRDVHFPDGLSAAQLLSQMSVIENADFSSVYMNPNRTSGIIVDCPALKTVLIPNIKFNFSDKSPSTIIRDCESLEYADVSGFVCDDVEGIWTQAHQESGLSDLNSKMKTNMFTFNGCPNLKKIRISFSAFMVLFCFHYITKSQYKPSYFGLPENFFPYFNRNLLPYNPPTPDYDFINSLEHFEIADLDDYKDFIESLTA